MLLVWLLDLQVLPEQLDGLDLQDLQEQHQPSQVLLEQPELFDQLVLQVLTVQLLDLQVLKEYNELQDRQEQCEQLVR